MTAFVNLTPHALRLRTNVANMAPEALDSDIVLEPRYKRTPSGEIARNERGDPITDPARVSATPGGANGQTNGVALFGRTTYGEVEGLPAPEQDTIYIVSALVGGRINGRDDIFCPGTGPKDNTVRKADGQIYAVTRLVQA